MTCTSEFIFGVADINDSGIHFSHRLCIYEHHKAYLVLEQKPTLEKPGFIIDRWIPHPDRVLEDCMVMAAVYVLNDKDINAILKEVFEQRETGDILDLCDVKEDLLFKLYAASKNAFDTTKTIAPNKRKTRWKVIANIFRHNIFHKNINKLLNYDVDIEICKSIFQYEYSAWTQNFEKWGELE